MRETDRVGDLVLTQGTYVHVQDGASGQVEVIVGPHKASLADTDRPVIYDHNTLRFVKSQPETAIQVNPTANEGQYIVLNNPTETEDGRNHPGKGKQSTNALRTGHKINIPGPYTMALYPSQFAKVLDGHLLKSNEYLLCRVYNEEAAKKNLKDAVIKPNESDDGKEKKVKQLISESDLVIGKLFVIKGTDVSFYIPPTGIEVVKGDNGYVRGAVTLERLEYCILLDQNGDKRFVQGPDVVFPKPTEEFVKQGGETKFKAIELNETMGLYVKAIADYKDEDGTEYKSGDELFITGKDQKIYFPRPEHAIVKYGNQMIHYSTAVPKGEARYVLDKNKGEVETVLGPTMLLPDPRSQVIIKRELDDRTVELWFPGNEEALEYNRNLRGTLDDFSEIANERGGSDLLRSVSRVKEAKSTVRFAAMADEMQRSNTYTKPRTITLNTKYEGAVRINVWPGYAIQVVKKTGERELIEGPKVRLLDYDEELEVLTLSTGKPKCDHNLFRVPYLQKENNVVSDIIEAVTSDSVDTTIRLSYRVNFDPEYKNKWFNVADYVKLLTQHMRSIVRNKVKKTSIEEFNNNATDIIRDLILGESEEGKRPGRKFDENGMHVYDIEVLKIEIGDSEIAEMLTQAQQSTVSHRIKIQTKQQQLEFTKLSEKIEQEEIDAQLETLAKRQQLKLTKIDHETEADTKELDASIAKETKRKEQEQAVQEFIDFVEAARLERQKADDEQKISKEKQLTEIRTAAHEKRMAAIQPKLIEAITAMSDNKFAEILAQNLSHKSNGFGTIFDGGYEGLLALVEGSPLEDKLKRLAGKDTIHSGE